jgi:hypothetical protein
MWISLGVMLLSALLMLLYLIETPGSSVMDLIDGKA